jgi:hypothetical protein
MVPGPSPVRVRGSPLRGATGDESRGGAEFKSSSARGTTATTAVFMGYLGQPSCSALDCRTLLASAILL